MLKSTKSDMLSRQTGSENFYFTVTSLFGRRNSRNCRVLYFPDVDIFPATIRPPNGVNDEAMFGCLR
jgi:hypothetical protein